MCAAPSTPGLVERGVRGGLSEIHQRAAVHSGPPRRGCMLHVTSSLEPLLLSGLWHKMCEVFPTPTGSPVLSGHRRGAPQPHPTLTPPDPTGQGLTHKMPPSDANLEQRVPR